MNYKLFKNKMFSKNKVLTGKLETAFFFIFASGFLLLEVKLN
jgi:hypothetical protein